MNNITQLTVVPEDNIIILNNVPLVFKFEISDKNIHAIQFNNGSGHIEFKDDKENEILTQESVNKLEQYVALWEAEKARLDKLKEQADLEYNKIENVISRKLIELEVKFQEAEEIGVISSSLGFSFTANNRALRDVESLIKEMEYTGKESDYIVAADNNMYELSASQLKTLFIELTQYGKQLYNTKWALRSKISKATTKEEVDAIQIVFITNYIPTSVILKI